MRILSFGNVGNFQTGYKDGIVVLTRLRGLLTTSVSQVSYDLQMKTWHNSSTLEPNNILYFSDYQIIHSIFFVI